MTVQTTYTEARKRLASLMDRAGGDREIEDRPLAGRADAQATQRERWEPARFLAHAVALGEVGLVAWLKWREPIADTDLVQELDR